MESIEQVFEAFRTQLNCAPRCRPGLISLRSSPTSSDACAYQWLIFLSVRISLIFNSSLLYSVSLPLPCQVHRPFSVYHKLSFHFLCSSSRLLLFLYSILYSILFYSFYSCYGLCCNPTCAAAVILGLNSMRSVIRAADSNCPRARRRLGQPLMMWPAV